MKYAMDSLRPDRIIRSRRRTISLEITADAALVVRAPLRATDSWIMKIVEEKRGWIEKKVAETKNRPSPGERRFLRGEEFMFLGKLYALEVLEGSNAGISLGCRSVAGFSRGGIQKRQPKSCRHGSPGSPQFLSMYHKKYGYQIHTGAGLRVVRPELFRSAGVLSLHLRK